MEFASQHTKSQLLFIKNPSLPDDDDAKNISSFFVLIIFHSDEVQPIALIYSVCICHLTTISQKLLSFWEWTSKIVAQIC